MAFLAKTTDEILRNALSNLTEQTPITSVGPGSIARAITEAITTELGDLYSIMDFNLNLSMVSTAMGSVLDLMGQLYNVERKTISDIAAIDKSLGSFYFYLDSPAPSAFTIPSGTRITTSQTGFVNDFFTYQTTESNTFALGQSRVYASIQPVFANSVFTAGAGSLTSHNFTGTPPGVLLKCYNPKPIGASFGYEDDDSYRTRIIKAVRTAAGGTEEACRFAILGLAGVRDCAIRTFPYGMGSFEVLVIPEDPSNATQVMANAANTLFSVRPVGVKSFLRQPDTIPIDLGATIVVTSDGFVDADTAAMRAQIAVLRYLNTMLSGTPLVYNQLIAYIIDSTPGVVQDVIVSNFTASGQPILQRNYTPRADAQIIPGNISISASTT